MTEFEEYQRTGMLGAYHPGRAVLQEADGGIQAVFRDSAYYKSEEAITAERRMLVGRNCFRITSVFSPQPAATPTKKLLAYIDADMKNY